MTTEHTLAPKKAHRYRSPNGSLRPYKDGERWIAPSKVTLPDGRVVIVRGTGRTRVDAEARLLINIDKRTGRTSTKVENDPALATVVGWARHWLENIKRADIRDSTYA
jgi:hypothetical protein